MGEKEMARPGGKERAGKTPTQNQNPNQAY